MNSNLRERIIESVKLIPFGQVTTYGTIAAMSGSPTAFRYVGTCLAGLTTNEDMIPWWRVVNIKGYLSIRNQDMFAKEVQKQKLLEEGVHVDHHYKITNRLSLWNPFNL